MLDPRYPNRADIAAVAVSDGTGGFGGDDVEDDLRD
jgi:hypothetical protein